MLILAGGTVGWWWQQQLLPVNPGDTAQVNFIIAKDEPATVTVRKLRDLGLVHSYWVAKLYLQGSGLDQKLKPGSYLVSKSQSLGALLTDLTSGPRDVWVTIPEGWRREQIAARFEAGLTGPTKQFNSLEFMQLTASLEGKLFPDTYLVPLYATAKDVVETLGNNFVEKVGKISLSDLIMASLVERETRNGDERAIVAGILFKRLKNNWPLQVDASIQYVQGDKLEWWPKEVNTKFLSTYNTYTHSGLPPSPIANPGLTAIEAVRHPVETEYWYYLHDSNGQIHYAKTLLEHNLNVDKYLIR